VFGRDGVFAASWQRFSLLCIDFNLPAGVRRRRLRLRVGFEKGEEARMTAFSGPGVLPEAPVVGQPWVYGSSSDAPTMGEGALYTEKRSWDRRRLHCTIQMIPLAGPEAPHAADALEGKSLNISDGGCYGTVPVGYGMGVGQSYVFRIRGGGSSAEGEHTVLRQGVIVRTELLLSPQGCDQIGFGVRFSGYPRGFKPVVAQA
jgi:hypothetical protein